MLIILKDNTIIPVNKEQAEKISNELLRDENKRKDMIVLKGKPVSIKSISYLTDAKTYYEQHPRKKPAREPFFKNFSALKEPVIKYSDARHKIRLENMKKGFLKGARVNSPKELSSKQSVIFNTMELALDKLENKCG